MSSKYERTTKVKAKPPMFRRKIFDVKCKACGLEFKSRAYIKPELCRKCAIKVLNGNFSFSINENTIKKEETKDTEHFSLDYLA